MPFTSQGSMLELHSMDGWMLNCIELYALCGIQNLLTSLHKSTVFYLLISKHIWPRKQLGLNMLLYFPSLTFG